jgi:hypothetical protein
MGQQALYQGPDRSEYFWLCGHIVSATTIQLYHCSKKTATDNMQMSKCDCVLIKLYLQKFTVGQTWLTDLCINL